MELPLRTPKRVARATRPVVTRSFPSSYRRVTTEGV